LVADQSSDVVSDDLSHSSRSSAFGQTTRLEHDDFVSAEPWFIEEAKGNGGRLAGAWWRDEHCTTMCRQRLAEIGEDFFYGE